MANIFKAFMYDLRTEGFVYAVKTAVWDLNPYAQLREAQAWMADHRETIVALSQEVVRLEATLEQLEQEKQDDDPNPYVFVPGDDLPAHITPRSWAYAYPEPVILTGTRPEDRASQTLGALVQSMPWPTIEDLHLPEKDEGQ
jgi:hypothetical protein